MRFSSVAGLWPEDQSPILHRQRMMANLCCARLCHMALTGWRHEGDAGPTRQHPLRQVSSLESGVRHPHRGKLTSQRRTVRALMR